MLSVRSLQSPVPLHEFQSSSAVFFGRFFPSSSSTSCLWRPRPAAGGGQMATSGEFPSVPDSLANPSPGRSKPSPVCLIIWGTSERALSGVDLVWRGSTSCGYGDRRIAAPFPSPMAVEIRAASEWHRWTCWEREWQLKLFQKRRLDHSARAITDVKKGRCVL